MIIQWEFYGRRYWLASSSVTFSNSYNCVAYCISIVGDRYLSEDGYEGDTDIFPLFGSNGLEVGYSAAVRPIVCLKNNIKNNKIIKLNDEDINDSWKPSVY